MLRVAGDEESIVLREQREEVRQAQARGFGGVRGRVDGWNTRRRAGEEGVLDLEGESTVSARTVEKSHRVASLTGSYPKLSTTGLRASVMCVDVFGLMIRIRTAVGAA